MVGVSSLGVGSGLDLQGLLDKLMNVERIPLQTLQKQASSYQSKISAMGTLSGQLSALQTALKEMMPGTLQTASQKFASYSGSLSDEKIGSVTIGDGATSGVYNLDVTKLATAQKIRSGVITDADVASKAGTQITISSGTLSDDGSTFTADATRSATITISPETNTLEKLRDAINLRTKDTGVLASIINDGNGNKRLSLASAAEGSNQAFRINSGGANFLDYDPDAPGVSGFTTLDKATNAQFTLDGIAMSSKGNTVTGVLEGVTLKLTETGTTKLNITRDDTTNLKAAMEKFVNAFNTVAKTINVLGAYDKETKTAGALNGNHILRESQSMLRSFVFNFQSETGLKLSDLGIAFGKDADNTLTLDAEKLTATIAKDPNAIAEMAAKMGKDFSDKIDKTIGIGGSLTIATDGMKSSISELEKRQEALELRMTAVETRYRKQFTSLDTMLAKLNSTGNFLTQQLTSLANMVKKKE